MPGARHRRVLITSLVVVAALVVVVLAGNLSVAVAYSGKAKPGMSVGGVGVAGKGSSDITQTVAKEAANIKLTITEQGQSFSAGPADLGMSVDTAKTVSNALSGERFNGVFTAFNYLVTRNIPLVASYDMVKMQQFLDSKLNSSTTLPTNATIAFDPSSQTFTARPGTAGEGANPAPVLAALKQAAVSPDVPVSVNVTVGPQQPPISQAAAQKAADWANARLKAGISLSGDSTTSYTLKPTDIAPWITTTPNLANGSLDASVDAQAVAKTLPGILESAFDVKAVNQVTLVEPDGKTPIVVSQKGVNGKTLADPSASSNTVAKALTANKATTIPVALTTQKFSSTTTTVPSNYSDPNGAKWVDVDLTTQTETLWQGSTKVTSFIIASGATTGGRAPTPDGVYYIWLRLPTQTMIGGGPVGSPTHYETPNVPWIQYFDHRGDALHGAYWLAPSDFGVPHSHGCINMKVGDAQFAYAWATLGTRVVVHGEYPGQAPAAPAPTASPAPTAG